VVLQKTCTASPCTLDDWWITGPLPAAAYQVQAVATDTAGASTTSAMVTIFKDATTPVIASGAPPTSGGGDTTPPTVAMTSPSEGTTISGTVTVSANATDNVGVAGVQFKLDDVNLGAELTTAPYSASWNPATEAAGSHTPVAVER